MNAYVAFLSFFVLLLFPSFYSRREAEGGEEGEKAVPATHVVVEALLSLP